MTANGGTKIPDRAPAEQADVTIVVLVCEEVAGVGPRYHGCSLNRVCAMGISTGGGTTRERRSDFNIAERTRGIVLFLATRFPIQNR